MNTALENAFSIISREESKKALQEALDSDIKNADIITAIFVRAFYHSFEEKCRDLFFSKEKEWDSKYGDYWKDDTQVFLLEGCHKFL